VDLRPGSPTYRQWVSVELTAANHRMVFIPPGLAHGFLTLSDDTELYYEMGARYTAEAARCVRWNDPAFGIAWPFEPRVVSDADRRAASWAE
jgi:dTDP-4-dehydrorhamnose 3,5-epimerase